MLHFTLSDYINIQLHTLTHIYILILRRNKMELEIRENPILAAGKYMAYEAPATPLTPAPEGYVPCYISTYARHGSRYLTGIDKYEPALTIMEEAELNNGLTDDGKKTLKILRQLAEAAENRYGELTPKGARQHQGLARQHQGLARRMFENYPEIFTDGAHIDARSTYKTRAFLSMAAACVELKGLNPKLNITTDASQHDEYFIKYKNPIYSDSCQHNADSVFAEAGVSFIRNVSWKYSLNRNIFQKSKIRESWNATFSSITA